MKTLPFALLSWLALAAALPAQAIQMVSVDQFGGSANSQSLNPDVSANGRYVAFMSDASDLVPGDTNGTTDVFVRDTLTGLTTRASVSSSGVQGNGFSWNPAISGDGQTVVFSSVATNLVTVDTNGQRDIFLHDMQTGQTFRMSFAWDGTQSNGLSEWGDISEDGVFVVFYSAATNIVKNDFNGQGDVFLFNRMNGGMEIVSLSDTEAQGNQMSWIPKVSGNGRYVAFQSSATNLVNGDTNGQTDVFVRDRTLKTTRRASLGSGGVQANGQSFDPRVSDDGRFVAFNSQASNLVSGDSNARADVFHHDLLAGTTVRVNPNNPTDSYISDLSADGLQVLFSTGSPQQEILRNVASGQETLVSQAASGGSGNADSRRGGLSPDGRFAAFESLASNLVQSDFNPMKDVFLHDNSAVQVNTITLSGPTTINTGSRFTYSWTNAPASSIWILYTSGKKNGATIQGHPFDIGPKLKKLGSGTNNSAGSGSWLSPKIGRKFSGRSFFLEVGAFKNGQVFDSNFLKVQIL